MMNDRNDYTEEEGTLTINSESSLDMIIYVKNMIKQPNNYKIQDMNRAVLYGIYRTFVHTEESQIFVTARHLDIKTLNPYDAEVNSTLEVRASATREKALKAVKKIIPAIKTFDDLVETQVVGDIQLEDEWIPEFEELYWKSEGQEKLLDSLHSFEN